MNDTYRSVDDAAYIQLRHNFMYTEKINKIEHIKKKVSRVRVRYRY